MMIRLISLIIDRIKKKISSVLVKISNWLDIILTHVTRRSIKLLKLMESRFIYD